MKKFALLLALTPLSVQAALVELWDFNNLTPGAVSGDTISNGVNGETATIRGSGAVITASPSTGGYQVDLPGGSGDFAA